MREIAASKLWIGNASDARDVQKVLALGIQAILDLAMEEPPIVFPRELIYCRCPLVDGSGNATATIEAAIRFLLPLVQANVPTLITCGGGMSRSPAVAAAVLSRINAIRFDDAIKQVAASGPHDVSPLLWKEVRAVLNSIGRQEPAGETENQPNGSITPRIKCWQVDAFASRAFAGNPAAVCWLEKEADANWMQAVAAEMNLSDTAFARQMGDGYELRWFTPTAEVDLCGHATLATAHALLSAGIASNNEPLRFHTRGGMLTCTRDGDFINLDFPSTPAQEAPPSEPLLDALGIRPVFVGTSRYYLLVVVESAEVVRSLKPNFQKLLELPTKGVIVTAAADDADFDFVSRFFAPALGVNEDPVCGSAHCVLAPYWAKRLNKTHLMAYQASTRGGVLRLRLNGDRVILGGQAVTVWQGELLCC